MFWSLIDMDPVGYIAIFQYGLLGAFALCTDINKFKVVRNKNITELTPQFTQLQPESLLHCVMLCNIDSECHSGSFDEESKECVRDRECSHQDSQSTYNFGLIVARSGKRLRLILFVFCL